MSNSSGKITTPISMTGDIRAVLGESATDFIALCQSTKVNMWSKVKPGTITKKSYSSLLALCKAAQSNVNASMYWTAPTGGYNMVKMWNGYNHNAVVPLQSWVLGDLQGNVHRYGQDATVAESAYFYYNTNAEVGVSDIGLGGLYAGVAIADSSLTQVALVTCSGTWASAVTSGSGYMCASQELNYGLFSASEARLCFPVLSSAKAQHTSFSSDVSGTFYALPLSSKSVTLAVVNASHKAYVTIVSAVRSGSNISLTLTPHVDNIVGTGKATTWASGNIPYTIEIVYGSHIYSYSFDASSTDTWSNGNWTGATVTHDLTAVSTATGGNYIMVTVSPNVDYISGTSASISC